MKWCINGRLAVLHYESRWQQFFSGSSPQVRKEKHSCWSAYFVRAEGRESLQQAYIKLFSFHCLSLFIWGDVATGTKKLSLSAAIFKQWLPFMLRGCLLSRVIERWKHTNLSLWLPSESRVNKPSNPRGVLWILSVKCNGIEKASNVAITRKLKCTISFSKVYTLRVLSTSNFNAPLLQHFCYILEHLMDFIHKLISKSGAMQTE